MMPNRTGFHLLTILVLALFLREAALADEKALPAMSRESAAYVYGPMQPGATVKKKPDLLPGDGVAGGVSKHKPVLLIAREIIYDEPKAVAIATGHVEIVQ